MRRRKRKRMAGALVDGWIYFEGECGEEPAPTPFASNVQSALRQVPQVEQSILHPI